jgi:hypothetical protein
MNNDDAGTRARAAPRKRSLGAAVGDLGSTDGRESRTPGIRGGRLNVYPSHGL